MNRGKVRSKPVDKGVRQTPHKILIVEDESLIRWSMAYSLRENCLEVTVVDSGEQALEELKAANFEVVITDFELPQIDGLGVAAAVKSCSPTTPVIMLSVLGEKVLSRPEESELIDRFVEKPFDLKEMVSLVNRLLCEDRTAARSSGKAEWKR